MGVTIHFEGRLSSADNLQRVIAIATSFAEENNMPYFLFEEEKRLLERVKDEKDWNYEGPTKGVQLQPHDNSDPFILEFDENLYVQEYCKTQFADISVHVLLVDLLRRIEPLFDCLVVNDEGEYWDTQNIDLLQQNMDNCFDMIDEAKRENENLAGPFRLETGRIVDLME